MLNLGKRVTQSTVLRAAISAIGMTYIINLQIVSIYPLLLFGICLFIYGKERAGDGESVYVKGTAILLSLFLAFGKIIFLREQGRLKGLVLFLLMVLGGYYFIKWAVNAIYCLYDAAEIRGGGTISPNKVFVISMLFFLICWIPFWLAEYPGVLTIDSIVQFGQIIEDTPLIDHHPIVHTMWIKFWYQVAYFLGAENDIQAYGFISMVQLILMAVAFSAVIRLIYRKTRQWSIVLPCLVFYGLTAYNGIYSVTMWKDVVHGVVSLLFLYFLYHYFETEGNAKRYLAAVFVFGCAFCLFRSNGWFAFLLWAVGLAVYEIKKKDRKLIAVVVLTAIVCSIIKGPVYSGLEIEKCGWVDSMSIPLQQIAYCMSQGDSLTDEERTFLEELAEIDKMPELYLDFKSDPIKHLFSEKDNGAYFAEHKWKFLSVWFHIGVRNPLDYVTAWVLQTYGYWYPAISYWVYDVGIHENAYELAASPILPEGAVNRMHDLLGHYQEIPLYGSLWCIGTFTWCLIITVSYAAYKKRWDWVILYAPFLCIWLTLLVATPVYAEFRYYYSVVASMPLILTLPLCDKREKP